MGKWKSVFESRVYSADELEFSPKYTFNPPATPKQIQQVEQAFGFSLPADVREMLLEFNGIQRVTPDYEIELYFSTEQMLKGVSDFIRQWDDEELDELAKHVVFVCHENGLADLYGVVTSEFAGFRPGEVVMVDHELVGSEESCQKKFDSLVELVRDGPRFP